MLLSRSRSEPVGSGLFLVELQPKRLRVKIRLYPLLNIQEGKKIKNLQTSSEAEQITIIQGLF